MSTTLEAGLALGQQANPNIVPIVPGLQLSMPHLRAVARSIGQIDAAYSLAGPDFTRWVKPDRSHVDMIDGGTVIDYDNEDRRAAETLLPVVLPFLGQTALSTAGEAPAPVVTEEQAATVQHALWLATRSSFIGKLSPSDLATLATRNAQGLLAYDFVRSAVNPKLALAQPFIEALANPNGQSEFMPQLASEVGDMLRHIQVTARTAVATRKKLDPTTSKLDKFLTRSDVALGLQSALAQIGRQTGHTPLLEQLIPLLQHFGWSMDAPIKAEHLDAGADLLIPTLIAMTPYDKQGQFENIRQAALTPSAASRKFSAARKVLRLPAVRRGAATGQRVLGGAPVEKAMKVMDLLVVYDTLKRELPLAAAGLAGLLAKSDKTALRGLNQSLLQGLDTQRYMDTIAQASH